MLILHENFFFLVLYKVELELYSVSPDLTIAYLYDSPAQSRHFCQFLQRLSIGVVVLGKLSLHHLQTHKARHRGHEMPSNTVL